MIDTEDLTSYISGYDDYCEPEKEMPEDDRDFYEDYLLEKGKIKMERKIIYLRYFKNMTQSSAAKILGMTQVQVSRREKKLLTEMRKELLS